MPANGSYLLDTNILIHLLNRSDELQEKINSAAEVFIPVIAVGELVFGVAKSNRPQENGVSLRQFLIGKTVLNCDAEVAWRYGDLKQQLRTMGKPIPENDLWIAAIAIRWRLVLVTQDQHFNAVPGLSTVVW